MVDVPEIKKSSVSQLNTGIQRLLNSTLTFNLTELRLHPTNDVLYSLYWDRQ